MMRSIVCTVLTVLLSACETDAPLHAVGTLERDRLELAADSREPITAIPVAEGDRVTAGQVLVRQDPAVPEARLAQARAARDEAAARLEEAVAGPRTEAIARAEARLAAAESAVITAERELRRERALAARDFASRNRLDVLEGRHDEAVARRQEARAALEELQAGTRSEQVRQAREALAAAQGRLREARIALDRTQTTAPVDAVVEALPLEIGERPTAGGAVAVVRALAPTYARVHVPEPLRTRLSVGAPALVHLDGREEQLPARVRWIASEAAFTPYYALTQRDRSRLSYAAEVVLTDEDASNLPAGVPVEVRFPTAVH